ncbi:MAG: D-alanine--D-alanine ligase [Lachnospiraceae bacterium]|nr:D-alanine--D-alanine ligase [Lachnospiraceae bacterium]
MKIVVLAGGTSTERDVSLATGAMIYQAFKNSGHNAVLLDAYLGYEENDFKEIFSIEKDWAEAIGAISRETPDMEKIRAQRKDGGVGFFGPHVMDICAMADMVFLALHGAPGEDGTVQAAFDLAGIRYTGSGYLGAAVAMDKSLSKELFRQNGIPTPEGFSLWKEQFEKGEDRMEEVPFPAVVKTCRGGSSVGVYMVNSKEEYLEALHKAFSYENQVIVEQYIKGREFSVGVLEGKALPIIEIAPLEGFYDYKNKYQAGSAVETCPADLSEELTKSMQKAAEHVFSVLRLKVYARMDFLLQEDGSFFCLEANTLPGMTKTSLLPQEAAAVGMDFETLCEKIIEISFKKYNE